MTGPLLDAGAFVAIDRGDRGIAVHLENFAREGIPAWTSAVILAQVWRSGRQANLARVLEYVRVAGLDEASARRTGELLGRAKTSDVADAHLALLVESGDTVLTSDAADIEHLLNVRGVKARVVSV